MIAQFALRLIVGMSLMWLLTPRRDVTSGFFRIQLLVTLGLSVLAALTGDRSMLPETDTDRPEPELGVWLAWLTAVLSFVGSVLWTLERRRAGTVVLFLIPIPATAALLLSLQFAESPPLAEAALAIASELSTASLVGGFVTAMLLGHWYLTAPTMTIRPLSRMVTWLGVFAAVRFALSAAAFGTADVASLTSTHWLWLWLRWTAGIAGPAICVFLVVRILKYRNTQSATGVLFVGVILTFIGELAATLLMREIGVPF